MREREAGRERIDDDASFAFEETCKFLRSLDSGDNADDAAAAEGQLFKSRDRLIDVYTKLVLPCSRFLN